MKKKDKRKDAKMTNVKTKRAAYEKKRLQKLALKKIEEEKIRLGLNDK